MKRVLTAVVAFSLLQAAWPVAAQQQPGPFGRDARERPDRQDGSRDRPPAREAAWPSRDGQDHGRMSQQEREQLRRDINSHGRDIYRQDRGRR